MRNNRRWFRKSLILLALPLIFALAGANGDGDPQRDEVPLGHH
jgi:hypothetical protein